MENYLECQDCGVRSEDVEKTWCPYLEEVYRIDEPIQVCKQCYSDRYIEV